MKLKKSRILLFILFTAVAVSQAQTKYPTIVIETNYGTMKAMLYDDTPVHNDHYLKLIKQGYFNGTLFHRVVKNFVIQAHFLLVKIKLSFHLMNF